MAGFLLTIFNRFYLPPLTVSEEARIEPRTVKTLTLAVILTNHWAGSHLFYYEGIENKIKKQIELEVNDKKALLTLLFLLFLKKISATFLYELS